MKNRIKKVFLSLSIGLALTTAMMLMGTSYVPASGDSCRTLGVNAPDCDENRAKHYNYGFPITVRRAYPAQKGTKYEIFSSQLGVFEPQSDSDIRGNEIRLHAAAIYLALFSLFPFMALSLLKKPN